MRIDLEVHGDVQVSRELLRFQHRVVDARPAFRQIATLLRHSEQRQFATGGKYASGGWAPLAKSTLAAKARDPKARYKRAILKETGALMESLTKRSDTAHTEVVQPHQLVFGSQVPYGKYHQTGTSRMPRRRPLEVRAGDRTEIVKTLQRFLVEGET